MITPAELQRAQEWARTEHGRDTMQALREELRALLATARAEGSVKAGDAAGITRGE